MVLQPTVDCTSATRALARQIDLDPTIAFAESCPVTIAAVTASVPGLPLARVQIPISGAPADHPMAAARAFRALDTFSYLDAVQA